MYRRFGNKTRAILSLLLVSACLLLSACVSSSVTRNAASSVDHGVQDTSDYIDGIGKGNTADAYQNSSSAAKGMMIGGATGAVTGAIAGATYSSVGVLPGTVVGAAAGAVVGAAAGASLDAHAKPRDFLENRGVNVIMLGDHLLIVIPSARIFNPYSATINPDAYSTLSMVSAYVNRYVKMLVKIAVFTNNTGSYSIDLALSQQQANTLEHFLIASGIDARVLYAKGYGGSHLVVRSADWDSDNYRIEITLEKLYV